MNPIRMGRFIVYGKAWCHSLASPVPHRPYLGRTTRHNGCPRPLLSSTVTEMYGNVASTTTPSACAIPYAAGITPLTGRLVGAE